MIARLKRWVRNSRAFAFVQGVIEHWDGCGGRTHPEDQDWNEAYDAGMNFADRLQGREIGA